MREPVATVLALAAAALREPGVPPANRVRLDQISGQAQWLSEMIEEVLRDAVREPAEDETVSSACAGVCGQPDVVRVVDELISAGRLTWGCDVSVTSPARPVRCTLHPVLLRRVVSNVLSNAARAAGPSGRVTIRIWQRTHQARLVVEDSGPGFGNIPGGLGLGLTWVARTIIRHGGRVECDRGAGGGARVSLCIP